jgi:serine/threonine protein phosphatase PrpC
LSIYNQKSPDRAKYSFTYSGLTHTGLVRTRNEDSFICLPEQNLWIVADGMGGHDSGDFASSTITQQAKKFTQQPTLDASILVLEENLIHSNELIQQKALKLGKKSTIGSTVACLYNWKNLVFVLWAGDSRVYRYRDKTLQRLTEDHSFVEELVRMGKIDASQAESHPAANVVLNAVGIEAELIVDMDYYEICDSDLFLLCSDGLYKDLSEEKIIQILDNADLTLEETNQQLIDAALEMGGNDNCTVVLVKAKIEEKDV